MHILDLIDQKSYKPEVLVAWSRNASIYFVEFFLAYLKVGFPLHFKQPIDKTTLLTARLH